MEADQVEGEPVEIHAPHGPINSYKEFLVHLGTITAGVLIALSLEGVMEWNHYRILVREAKENIRREIEDNLKDIDTVLAKSGERKQRTDTALRFVDELLRTKKTDVNELQLGFEGADLNNASWQTAERTGALAHMEYADVKRYSHLYNVQETYASLQRQNLDRLTAALQFVADGNDPTLAPPAALEAFREQIMALRAGAFIEDEIGHRLADLYRETSKE